MKGKRLVLALTLLGGMEESCSGHPGPQPNILASLYDDNKIIGVSMPVKPVPCTVVYNKHNSIPRKTASRKKMPKKSELAELVSQKKRWRWVDRIKCWFGASSNK